MAVNDSKSVKKDARKKGQKIVANEIDKLIGMRIRVARSMFGEKQEYFADLLGVTIQQIQKYENGKSKISMSILAKIASDCGIPISFFIPPQIGTPRENAMDIMKAMNFHHVAEDWKPIGSPSAITNQVKPQEAILNNSDKHDNLMMQIIELLGQVTEEKQQKEVVDFLKVLTIKK